MATTYLGAEAILFIHERVLESFGGGAGVRDLGALKAAIDRPKSTFSGQELYPTIFEKAAVLLESLCQNHPFVDGNKRTSYTATGLFLQQNGWTLEAATDDAVSFMLEAAKGKLQKEEIRIWIEKHVAAFGESL